MTTRGPTLLARSGDAAIAAVIALALGAGCMGSIGDQAGPGAGGAGSSGGGASGGGGVGPGDDSGAGGGVGGSQNAPTSFTCDPTQKRPVEQLRALTRAQFANTLADLASWALHDPKAGATVTSEIASALAALPANLPVVPQTDPVKAAMFPDGGYFREDQDQQYARVQAYYAVGNAIGASLTSGARLGTLVGSCAADGDASNDAACLTSFIQSFGARALRRPVTGDDVTFYSAVYGTDTTANPAAYADVVSVMLQAPDFLYLVEHGDQPVAGASGVYTLSATELASRLSYHVWDTMPDDELWSAALDGSLLTDAAYQKEVARLFADPRARAALDRFFADYLQTDATGGIMGHGGLNYRNPAAYAANPVYQALAAGLPTATLGQDMVDDVVGMLDYYVWAQPGTVHDLLTSELSFAKSAALATVYGVAPWDGASQPPPLPAGQRPGIFTRALFLAAGPDTNPILKGVFLRRYALCDSVGKPPAAAANATIDLNPNETTRQVVTELTKNPPCSGCHPTWINPLGFVTESFDGLGRFRTAQTLFNTDGTVAGTQPVDTSSVPRVDMNDGTTAVKGVADLMPLVEASHKVEACLARNYFRYTFARFEDTTLDGCTLEAMRKTLDPSAGPAHLADLFQAVVLAPAFKQRTFD